MQLDLRVSITGGVHFDLVKRVLRDINRSGQAPEEIIQQVGRLSLRGSLAGWVGGWVGGSSACSQASGTACVHPNCHCTNNVGRGVPRAVRAPKRVR